MMTAPPDSIAIDVTLTPTARECLDVATRLLMRQDDTLTYEDAMEFIFLSGIVATTLDLRKCKNIATGNAA